MIEQPLLAALLFNGLAANTSLLSSTADPSVWRMDARELLDESIKLAEYLTYETQRRSSKFVEENSCIPDNPDV